MAEKKAEGIITCIWCQSREVFYHIRQPANHLRNYTRPGKALAKTRSPKLWCSNCGATFEVTQARW